MITDSAHLYYTLEAMVTCRNQFDEIFDTKSGNITD